MDKQDKFYLELGRRIRNVRLHFNLTQEQLADLVSLSRTSITNIEKGKQKILAHTLVDLTEKLRVPIDKLIPLSIQMSENEKINNLLDRDSSPAQRFFFEAAMSKARKR
jgi:transcriptional regulator with XRE-family HTH domain